MYEYFEINFLISFEYVYTPRISAGSVTQNSLSARYSLLLLLNVPGKYHTTTGFLEESSFDHIEYILDSSK